MMVECSCGWAGISRTLDYNNCPKCGKKLTIRNSDEANDHYDYPDDEEPENPEDGNE